MRLIASLLIALIAGQAQASECIPRSPESIAKEAKVAFIGTVKAVDNSSYKRWSNCPESSPKRLQCGGKLVTLEVSEQLRGNYSDIVTVVGEDACYCLGPYWKPGIQYLVIGRPSGERFQGRMVADDVCGGRGELTDHATPVVNALRSAKGEADAHPKP